MKKKGLIVATIVMVLVLAVSLTTATYAWFTQANVTTIDGFGIEVAASAAVKIGLKTNNTYTAGASADAFVSGSVVWNPGTRGVIGTTAGSWGGGDVGLSATLDHNISFGKVSRAVGVTTATVPTNATEANTKGFAAVGSPNPTWSGYTAETLIIGAQKGETAGTLAGQELAVCNLQGTGNSDFAYLFLGAMPTKMLRQANELIILVQSTGNGTTIGIAAAVHVAYRLNDGVWQDIDVFGDVRYTASKEATTVELDQDEAAGFNGSANGITVEGAAVHKITLTADGKDNSDQNKYAEELDQIELIIYLAGWDNDCIDQAKGAVGTVSIFFDAKTVAEG